MDCNACAGVLIKFSLLRGSGLKFALVCKVCTYLVKFSLLRGSGLKFTVKDSKAVELKFSLLRGSGLKYYCSQSMTKHVHRSTSYEGVD